MKILFLCSILTFFCFSCAKKKPSNEIKSNTYWQEQAWDYSDDDGDGISNASELKQGTHPELISPPDIKGFTLSNIIFFDKKNDKKLFHLPLRFIIDDQSAHQFLYSAIIPPAIRGQFPFQSYQFDKEHIILQSTDTYIAPNVFHMVPKIDKNYLNFMSTLFYERKSIGSKFNPDEAVHVSLALNFPSNLSLNSWQKIRGTLTWGDQIIPWEWTKEQASQINWQIQLTGKDWIDSMKNRRPIKLIISDWEIATPIGNRTIDQNFLNQLTPFYVLSSKGFESGWHYSRAPLPADHIVNRPTKDASTSPWYFFRLDNTDKKKQTYWLKELSHHEDDWLQNIDSLKWSSSRYDHDVNFLPLPPHENIRSLKMKIWTTIYNHKALQVPVLENVNGKPCKLHYPVFDPNTAVINTTAMDLGRMLNGIIINKKPLRELIKSEIALTFENSDEDSESYSSITLNWDKNFKWDEFSLRGLENEYFRVIIHPNELKVCPELIDSPNKRWPQFKHETFHFEWQY